MNPVYSQVTTKPTLLTAPERLISLFPLSTYLLIRLLRITGLLTHSDHHSKQTGFVVTWLYLPDNSLIATNCLAGHSHLSARRNFFLRNGRKRIANTLKEYQKEKLCLAPKALAINQIYFDLIDRAVRRSWV